MTIEFLTPLDMTPHRRITNVLIRTLQRRRDGGPARAYVVGLIGSGIGTSLSPELHEHEADELGLRYIYQLIDIGELGLSADDVGVLVPRRAGWGFAA
jgi:hypothetical protein